MSRFSKCPECGNEASGGMLGGIYIKLHECKDKGHHFCDKCKNGDACPRCGCDDIYWNSTKAYTNR